MVTGLHMIAFMIWIAYTCGHENAPIRHYPVLCRVIGFLFQ
jgi:hypothetical protein